MGIFQFHLCRRNKRDLPDDGDLTVRTAEKKKRQPLSSEKREDRQSEADGKAKATPKQRGSTPDSIEDRFAKLENLVMSLAQSLTGPSTTALHIEEERRAAAKMGNLLAQDVAEKGKEKEEPLPKKTKKSEGLTISNQCKPAEEERRTKSISDLAKAVNELGEDAPTEEAKVDDEVSKSQGKKNRKSQQEDVPPSQPRWSKEGDEDDLEGSHKSRKEKSWDFTVNDEDE